jgi:hypothetical protein
LIAPSLFDHGVVSGVRNYMSTPHTALLEIPCFLPTVAEIVMAAAENRSSEFQPVRDGKQYPVGRRQLPNPPEAGIAASKENPEAISKALMGKLVPGSWTHIRNSIDDYMFTKFARSSGGSRDPNEAERIELASAWLRHASKVSRYYVVYRMPEGEAARRELNDGLSQLKKDYQDLVFLGLTDDYKIELAEVETYGPLITPAPTFAATKPISRVTARCRSAACRRIRGGCTKCTAMSSSGARTTGMTVTKGRRRTARLGLIAEGAPRFASCAAGRGAATRGACALLSGTTTSRRAAASALAFAVPEFRS